MRRSRVAVVEMPEFVSRAIKLLEDSDRAMLIDYLAANPESGVLLQGTGGVRKLRWARPRMGKSGGLRVIYYFHSYAMPLFLIAVFAKNEMGNIGFAARNALGRMVDDLVDSYTGRKQ